MRILALIGFLFSVSAYGAIQNIFKVDGSEQGIMQTGKTSRWTLEFFDDQTNMPIDHFMPMHDKLMHMIVVSESLESFAHVHPTLNHMMGRFEITVNAKEVADPDNQDLLRTVNLPGNYFVFTESMPHTNEMLMQYTRHQFRAENSGTNPVIARPTRLDPIQYFDFDGKSAKPGAAYRASFRSQLYSWCSWWIPKFFVKVEAWDANARKYSPVTQFQDWLTMGGHAVLVSRNKTLKDRSFYHLHALQPIIDAGEFIFPYHDHLKPMDDGDYRLWSQFKINDKIYTVAFDFIYQNPPAALLTPSLLPCF